MRSIASARLVPAWAKPPGLVASGRLKTSTPYFSIDFGRFAPRPRARALLTGASRLALTRAITRRLSSRKGATQKAALGNIQNHINAVGAENIEVKVVMHGDGISLLMEPDALEGTKMKAANATPDQQAKISGLKDQGVTFEICANTLKGREVSMDALYDAEESDIVPSGVAELSRLQQMGYTYIKP